MTIGAHVPLVLSQCRRAQVSGLRLVALPLDPPLDFVLDLIRLCCRRQVRAEHIHKWPVFGHLDTDQVEDGFGVVPVGEGHAVAIRVHANPGLRAEVQEEADLSAPKLLGPDRAEVAHGLPSDTTGGACSVTITSNRDSIVASGSGFPANGSVSEHRVEDGE